MICLCRRIIILKTSRAMYHLKQLVASSFEWPADTRRATYSFVFGSSFKRPIVMICKALFAAPSPPLFKRCLVALPDETGTGLTPHRTAKPDSDLRALDCRLRLTSIGCAIQSYWVNSRQFRHQFSYEGLNHYVQIKNFIVQFKISSRQSFKRYLICFFGISISCQI